MSRSKTERTKHRCSCGNEFFVRRNYANRNADIRYCNACKEAVEREQYGSNRVGGAPKRISKFNTSGKISIMAD